MYALLPMLGEQLSMRTATLSMTVFPDAVTKPVYSNGERADLGPQGAKCVSE